MGTEHGPELGIDTSVWGIGIDIGGSGIKGAPVDFQAGALATERCRIPTPTPSTPQAVAEVVAKVIETVGGQIPADHPVGVTFPAVVRHGVTQTAANVDQAWIGTDADALFTERLGRPVAVVNDADAAGLAEAHFGAAKGNNGLVMVITLGTGIGSALIMNGQLVPNTELGHLEIDGKDAEKRASAATRERLDLSWSDWAKRLHKYFRTVENLFWPDLFVVGGGVSKRSEKFLPLLNLRTPIVPAQLRNDGGIIGAALVAAQRADSRNGGTV